MESEKKRKGGSGNTGEERPVKLSKGGNGGSWQTPHHKAKLASLRGRNVEVGDVGIWTTCQRHKEGQAQDELMSICGEYVEKMYGIKQPQDDADEEDGDIEASIQKELAEMKAPKNTEDLVLQPLRVGMDCVIFLRTKSPVDPIALAQRICEDAQSCTDRKERKSRFINRFSPVTMIGKASENGLDEVANQTLAQHFQLAETASGDEPGSDKDGEAATYAIRPTIRAHSKLKKKEVIDKVASLISDRHKVNLTSPDKVILIDICQTLLGMSVVDGSWESEKMKRYNLHEIYESAIKTAKTARKAEQQANGD